MMANNKENYAILLEEHYKEKDNVSNTMIGKNTQTETDDQFSDGVHHHSSSKHGWKFNMKTSENRHRLSFWVTYWPLLLTIGAFVMLVTFHLWFTLHLQRKVELLQTKVDALSTFDLEEIRAQLGHLYNLCDDCEQMKISLSEKIDFDDQDQGNVADKTLLEGDDTNVEETESLEDYLNESIKKDVKSLSSAYLESDQMVEHDSRFPSNDLDPTRSKRILESSNGGLKVDGRRKRQADLSSHTQDGVPIFDRGYGVNRNRTEGLRIYQSLLANDGRGESRVSDNLQTTDTPTQPIQNRQSNFWRGRKDKPRHRHHFKPSTTSPSLDDSELRPISDYDASNSEDSASRSFSATSSPLQKSSPAPNVEFRHSRVKASADGGSPSPISASMDQNPWSTSSRNTNGVGGNIFSIGVMPHSSSSLVQEERISAATAPAILTKTIATSVGPSASNRARQQQSNVFKVTQPAAAPRLPSVSSSTDNTEETRDSIPLSSSSTSTGKRRINKKQLRDLSHTATAVHLVADTRNSTSNSNYENQVEIASRNELGLHTSWKIASNDWDSSPKTTPLIKIDGAILTVKQSGLYFIYAQVHYLDDHPTNAYEVFINTEPFLRCVTTAYSESSVPKANTCYTAAATHLREGDKLFLRDIEPLRYSILQPSKTFLGFIRMAPIADFS